MQEFFRIDITKRHPNGCRAVILLLDRALDLVRTQASCTDMNMARSAVNDRLDALDVGLPGSVGTSMGVRNLDTKSNALAADIAFCHSLHLLAIKNQCFCARLWTPFDIIADEFPKCKHNFALFLKNFTMN